jgi:hypothetical protein
MTTQTIKAQTKTEQALSFIQSKIAEVQAIGGDIFALLANPEVAFSLQVLESSDHNMVLTPVTVNIDQQKVQIFTMLLANANNSAKQTADSHF